MDRTLRLALALMLFTAPFRAQELPDGAILETKAYEFPSYEQAVEATDLEKYAQADEYRRATADERFVLEKVRYRSDGLSVLAYVYRPRVTSALKLPAVVFNRGSYVRGDIAPELVPMFHRLAGEGFVVLAPLYRQSEGAEGVDEMGGADLNDLMNIVPLAKNLEFVDLNQLFLYGESRGGMMVLQAIRDGFPARAAATFGAVIDFEEVVSSGGGAAMAKQIWPDFETRREEILARRSAIQWPETLTAPLLLMHGSDDGSVPVSQPLRLALELSRAERDFALRIFEQGNHTLSRFATERDRLAAEHFRNHAK